MAFGKALPVWVKGRARERNTYALFRARVTAGAGAALHIAGTAFYRVWVNRRFLAFGPARTAKGYVREDVLPLPAGVCEVIIEACGYYCRSLSTVRQPSFLRAEITDANGVSAYTGGNFECYAPPLRVQKADRYSVQRHFGEVWDYRGANRAFSAENRAVPETSDDALTVLDRRAPYPLYEDIRLPEAAMVGSLCPDDTLEYTNHRYSWSAVPEEWGVFADDEIPFRPFVWAQRRRQLVKARALALPLELNEGEYAVFDFHRIEAGFLAEHITAETESDIVIAFAEFDTGDTFRFAAINAQNVIEYLLPEGERECLSFEPYTFRRCILMVKRGKITLRGVGVKTFAYNTAGIGLPECSSETVRKIAECAVRTFAHNAVDLYTDCPSRERGGWLCDSYFTARAEFAMTGKTAVEDAFLENYRLFRNRGEYPDGVVPMCYPSDPQPFADTFIPQWTMWYILEIGEYVLKRGHGDSRGAFREQIDGLLAFYRRYENADGLLEDLPAMNFVEWSDANKWTKDVNYPTNFLYSAVLETVYRLYGDEACLARCRAVRAAAVEQSFNGRRFADHAVRENGERTLSGDCSEICQYYAALFGGIDLQAPKYAQLKDLILRGFAPDRGGRYPEITEVNAFIGAVLRIDTLLAMGEYRLALRDISGFFGKMGEETGTLWEFREADRGSKDHGFASVVYEQIAEAEAGLRRSRG